MRYEFEPDMIFVYELEYDGLDELFEMVKHSAFPRWDEYELICSSESFPGRHTGEVIIFYYQGEERFIIDTDIQCSPNIANFYISVPSFAEKRKENKNDL